MDLTASKDSGFGREGCEESLHAYTVVKSVMLGAGRDGA
jgi:hypothetical protein